MLRSMRNFECFCVRKVLWSKVGVRAEKNFWKRQVYRMLNGIPERKVLRYFDRMVYRADRKASRMVRILLFPTPNDEWGYYRCWYENSADIVFEGKTFRGIKDYDSYLRFKFKDYWKLPSEDKRKCHPVSSIKL